MTIREVVGHINEAGEMAKVDELVSNVTGVISGDTNHLSVLKQTKLDRGSIGFEQGVVKTNQRNHRTNLAESFVPNGL